MPPSALKLPPPLLLSLQQQLNTALLHSALSALGCGFYNEVLCSSHSHSRASSQRASGESWERRINKSETVNGFRFQL